MTDIEMPMEEPKVARPRSGLNLFNLLTALFLLLSCLSAMCVAVVFAFPGVVPGPLQAPSEIALATLPPIPPTLTPSNTPLFPTLPPEWTATFTPTPSNTPTPTDTPLATPTNTQRGPTKTPTRTPTRTPTPSKTPTNTPTGPTPTPSRTRSPFQYTLQGNAATYLANFANSAGCKWMGFAGQAFDLSGKPVVGLLVHLEGGGVNLDTITGSKPEYGSGGYEFAVNDHPVQTTNTYVIQLRLPAGQPLSDAYMIPTFGTCDKNLALVNFTQNH